MRFLMLNALCLPLLLLWCGATGLADDPTTGVIVEELVMMVNKLMIRLDAQENEIAMLKGRLQNVAAFSAHISVTNISASIDTLIPFQAVDTNRGNAYDSLNSTFTAPYDGVYFFIVSMDVSHDYLTVKVKRNGGRVIIHADKDDQYSTHVTGNTVVQLQAGDRIAVYQAWNSGSLDGGTESTFSGFLVSAL